MSLPARQRFDPDAVDHQAGVNPGPVVGRATGVIDQTQFPGAVDRGLHGRVDLVDGGQELGQALADHLAQPIGGGRDSALRQQRVVQRLVGEHLLLTCQLGGVPRRLALTGQIADKFGKLDASLGRCALLQLGGVETALRLIFLRIFDMGAALEAIKGDTIRVERNRMESLDGRLEGQEALVMAAIQGMGFGQGLALAPAHSSSSALARALRFNTAQTVVAS